ncbi:DUF2334 domain-containing protein [Sphingomonas sp. YL-JM2C]
MKARYLFRLDDICPTMDWARFNAVADIFMRFEVQPLLGVIPDNKDASLKRDPADPRFWDKMRHFHSARGWTISQHGYQHQYVTQDAGILGINKNSEFAGLPRDIQFEKIAKGKIILTKEGLATDIFMPPSHSFDQNTIDALMDSEFRFVTDGYSILPYERKGIKFIPCQISRLIPIPIGLVTFCLHTNTIEADFPEKLNHFLTNNRNRTINFTEAAEVRASASQVLIEGVVLSVRRAAHSVRARRRAV